MQQYLTNPINVLFALLKEQKYKIMLLVMLIMLAGFSSSINAILLKNIVDAATQYSNNSFTSQMLLWGGLYVFWYEAMNLLYRLYDYLYMKTMPQIKGSVVDYFYNQVQQNNHAFFQSQLAGNISNRIIDLTKSVEYLLSSINEKIIKKLTSVSVALITIYLTNAVFAVIFISWLALCALITIFFTPTINNFSSKLAAQKAELSGRVVDAISNIAAIRMFDRYVHERQYLRFFIDKFKASDFSFQWFLLKIRYVFGLLCSIMMCLMLYFLTKLKIQEQITAGDFVLILSICSDVIGEIWDLSEEFGDALEDYGAFKQSCLLLIPSTINDLSNASSLQVTQGQIEFCNVVFSYSGQETLFNNKSLIIAGKEKIGLVGYSGSGKTSFVNLINRLYDIDSGQILIDGQNIAHVTQQSLKNAISFIPQDPMLFHRSIMDNIGYGKLGATSEEIIEAAKKAHIHDVIMNMPDGYNSLCGEKGDKLSGGQRQRIVIARAILKNAPILILDEATSSLDSLTENLIQSSLQYLMQNKTVLVIAHRLATLLEMDRILVFEKGRIVESGAHQALLQQKGLYYKFWHSQHQGYLTDAL
jgi:ATP-binding cassette subfamily B protein